jgi:hypothetical protein
MTIGQYILWINDNKNAWTARAAGFAADDRVQIGPRPIPQEPMVLQKLSFSPADPDFFLFSISSLTWECQATSVSLISTTYPSR